MAKLDRHFETTALQTKLKQRSLQSGLVAMAAQPLKLAIGVGGTMTLARLLGPADFGLLAMVQPLLSLVDSLSNLGLETATVQRQELNREQASAIFWLSLQVNGVIITAMILAGPLLSWFYGQPELTLIVWCLAVGVASLCLSFQHMSLLKRQMRFELLTTIEVVALVISTVVAIATAWWGLGYWALILQLITLQGVKGLAYWLCCDWRPQLRSTPNSVKVDLRSTLSYGIHLTGFRCISRVGLKMDRVLLGYVGGASTLGLYSMAYQWAYFPFWQVYYPLFDVAVSSFSRSLATPERYRAYCRRGLMLLFAVCLPALALLFIMAGDVTLVILGQQWLQMVPIFRVLIIAVFVGSLYRVTKWIYVSAGATQRQFRWSLIHTPIMIIAIAIGVHWGALGVAIGYTTAMVLLSYPAVVFCVGNTPITLRDILSAVWRPAIASIVSAIGVYLVQTGLPALPMVVLDLGWWGLVYALLYSGIWLLLPGGQAEALDLLRILNQRKL